MIRFRLSELIADAQFRTGKRVTLLEVSQATGINRITLSRMTNVRGYSTSTDTIDKLCRYFGCDVVDVAKYVEDEAVEAASTAQVKEVAPASSASKAAAQMRSGAITTKVPKKP
jgi:putative transcriptional regulator